MIDYQNVSLTHKVSGPILKNLTFDIQEGEFFVLIGPSGSGKTTTLKLINRLIEQTDGDILFQGKRLKDFDLRDLRLETGYVLQFPTTSATPSLQPSRRPFTKTISPSPTQEPTEK
ncbi:ATP-binding cassette domain-containing protein [Streptococcus suis]